MKRKNITLVIGLAALIFLGFGVYKTLQIPEEETHYHANFAVFIQGDMVNFSKDEFMHITPCGPEDRHNEEDEEEKAHLHDRIGNVVHVHHDGVTWSDLFENLRFDIDHIQKEQETKGAVIKYYLNKKRIGSILERIIAKDDRLLISIGSEKAVGNVADDKILKQQFDKVGNNARDYDEGKKGAESCGGEEKRSLIERFKIAFRL